MKDKDIEMLWNKHDSFNAKPKIEIYDKKRKLKYYAQNGITDSVSLRKRKKAKLMENNVSKSVKETENKFKNIRQARLNKQLFDRNRWNNDKKVTNDMRKKRNFKPI